MFSPLCGIQGSGEKLFPYFIGDRPHISSVHNNDGCDERVVMVKITKEGKALRTKARNIPAKAASCLNLNAEDAAQLYQLLQKILEGKKTGDK